MWWREPRCGRVSHGNESILKCTRITLPPEVLLFTYELFILTNTLRSLTVVCCNNAACWRNQTHQYQRAPPPHADWDEKCLPLLSVQIVLLHSRLYSRSKHWRESVDAQNGDHGLQLPVLVGLSFAAIHAGLGNCFRWNTPSESCNIGRLELALHLAAVDCFMKRVFLFQS